jgi:hypothetical protein
MKSSQVDLCHIPKDGFSLDIIPILLHAHNYSRVVRFLSDLSLPQA